MTYWLRLIIAASLLACVDLSTVRGAGARQATPTPAVVTPVTATQRLVEFPDGELISLSPDGRWLVTRRAIDGGSELCALDTASRTQRRCAGAAIRSVEWPAAVWSPDGTRLAFTEDWPIPLDESDLWVFDAVAGSLTDLTDDQLARSGILSPEEAPLDVGPAWSPDGQELAFIRIQSENEGDVTVGLFRIPADGGEPRSVATIGDDPSVIFTTGVRWAPDGRTILYSIWPSSDNNGGIWSVPAAGGSPSEFLTELAGISSEAPFLVDLNARGQALVYLPTVAQEARATRFAVVDLMTGNAVPLGSEMAEGFAVAAALSPDGARVALIYQRPDGSQFLAVRDLAGEGEQIVAEMDVSLPQEGTVGLLRSAYGLSWASNGVLFNRGSGQTGVLLHIASA
jgi:Tol biopolymer transport system component